MLCPKCYGKIDKTNRCTYCGFHINEMQGATNKEAKKALKGIYKDDVLYSHQLPADVSKKNLLLFAIFLGLFGAHQFYVGKLWQGLYMCITNSVLIVLFLIISILHIVSGTVLNIYQFALFFQGVNIILWLSNIISISVNRFKVPVYKESFSKKK